MAHVGDKYSAEDLKRKKIEEAKTELNRIWTLHPAYIKAKYIAEEARQHNAWLYDPTIKRWYTPEEFVSETSQFPDDAQIFTKIQIRNPIDGINAGYKQVASIYEKLQAFTQRVFDYYSKK
jgi:hypothetical protein